MNVPARASLAAILTAARAGSIGHAWAIFEGGGWAAREGDPAALAVKARLLKDRALAATGAERQTLLLDAAQTYCAAGNLRPQPYTAINEASLRLLAGDAATAAKLAGALLAWLAHNKALGEPIPETPYYLAATRAEAHLLRGDIPAAIAAMRDACAADPDGWADRAYTLRQFTLILAATGAEAGWLDEFRPPLSLNFAGHLGVAPDDTTLRGEVDAWLARMNIGFGYGALAAGADIIIAEAVLARGGELHVILPTTIAAFAAQSVVPFGESWRARFDACLAGAHSVCCLTALDGAYEPLATKLAADIAMGSAVLNARSLTSHAAQLLVIDDAPGRWGAGLATAYIGERWHDRARQHCLVAPRTAPVIASGLQATPDGRPDRRLAAMLLIAFDGLDRMDENGFAQSVDTVIAPFRQACAGLPVQPDLTLPMGNARLVAFADPDLAWHFAKALLALPALTLPLRLAGHYALAHWLDDPAALVGRGVAELGEIATGALPGVLNASETLTAALCVNLAGDFLAEHIGEAGALRLYALSPKGQ